MTDDAYVRLRVGGEHYALPVSSVEELAPIGEVMPMPGAPPHLLGVRSVRGDVVPVVDFATLAGLGGAHDTAMVAIVGHGGRRAALAVDQVVDVGPVHDVREDESSELLRGAAMTDGQLVGVLDPEAVLRAASWRQDG